MKQERKRQILQFVEDKGFYIILALCVAAIGISGYVLFFTEGEPQELPVVMEDPDPEPQSPVVSPDPWDSDEDLPAVTPDKPTLPSLEPQDTPTMRPEVPVWTAPVQGTVLRTFSGEDLVYDTTMGDWRTHNGIDYAAPGGQQVVAVCAGTVGAVWTDGLRGNCVRLDCGDQIYVTYCGLAANDAVSVGMKVEAGQPIGTVGSSMLTESLEESHLHLEVVRAGKYLDPQSYLK